MKINSILNFSLLILLAPFAEQAWGSDAVQVSPTIVEKYEKLNALRESSGLQAADRGNACWVYKGKTNEGEVRQACIVFIGDQRCVVSNYRGLRCGTSGREADCKIKRTGELRCDNQLGLVKVSKRCYNNEYGEKVCSAGASATGSARVPASSSSQKKRRR